MAKDDYWRLAGVPVNGHPGPESIHTYGESYTFTALLTAASDSDAGAWPDYIERYRELRGYQPYAGHYALHELTSGRVAYTETHTADHSLLVALKPPADTRTGLGGYWLISACEGLTSLPSALCQLDFGLTFVAALSEYTDVATARDALEAPI